MSHLEKQLTVIPPKDDKLSQARSHTLQRDASGRQKIGKATSRAAQKRERKKFAIVNWKPGLPTIDEPRRLGSNSTRKLPHSDPKRGNDAIAIIPRFLQPSTSFLWLKQGQSDPFDAQAITVTPEVNEIISFGRDVFLPTLHNTTGAKQSFTVNNNFQESVSRLSSQGSAFGLLSYFATAASLVAGGPTWAQKAIEYEVKCTSTLREKLITAPISQYPELITQILTLFGCTILTGRMVEAKTHATILRKLFDTSAQHGPVEIAKLCFALYHDRNLSAMFLVRSSFDVDHWVPQLITPIWRMLGRPFTHLSDVPQQKLDKSIAQADPSFVKLIDDIRNHYHTVVLTRKRWSQDTTPSNLVMYHISHSVIYELRLINYYLSLTSTHPSTLPQQDLWPQAYICLATLYMAHSLLYSGLVRLSDTSAGLKAHLIAALLNADRTATLHSRHRYTHALLWALFIGATAERIGHGASNDGSRWFHARFKAQLLSMGLTRWRDVRDTMLGFPCAAELLKQDVAWVEAFLKPEYAVNGTVRTASSAFRMYNNETGGYD